MASSPITSWEIDGETVETVSDLILGALKSLQMGTAAMKLKDTYFEKINKIDKPLVRLIKKKGRRIKSTKLEMKFEKSQPTKQKYKGS